MPTFNADQIIGKYLIAKKDLRIWKTPPQPSKNIKGTIWNGITLKKGNSAGMVFSYVGGTGGEPLFWMFQTPGVNSGQIGSYFYVEHKEGNFDVKSLREQGVLTTQEIQEKKEEENKSTTDKILDTFKKFGTYILIGGAVYYGYKAYTKK
jgi:hypothetical protein